MQERTSTPPSADALMPLQQTRGIVAALPADDAVAAARQIAAALRALKNDAKTVALEERYDDICLLDGAMMEPTRALLREYVSATRHMKQREADVWNSAYRCWCELADAYNMCVTQYTGNASAAAGFRKLAGVAAGRALRAMRRQLQWLRIRHAMPPPALWTALAGVYIQVDVAQRDEPMLVYPGDTSTLRRELLKTLALSVVSDDNLMPAEHDLATYIVNRFSGHFVASAAPGAGCSHSFDLRQPQAPVPISAGAAPLPQGIYFGAGTAVAALEDALRTLEQVQQVPPQLGFTRPIEPAHLTPVLKQIYQDWAGQTTERRYPRENANARVSVVPGFRETIEVLDQAAADPLDFTVGTSAESWIASDISADGFGVVMPAVSGDWVSVGSVVGIEGSAAGEWSVGVVRRIRRLDDGQQHIGVKLLCRNAQAVRVMRDTSGKNTRITQRMPIDRGVLLTAHALRQKDIDLLVSDAALYSVGNVQVLIGDSVLTVKLREVLEVAVDCTRINFTVLGVEA